MSQTPLDLLVNLLLGLFAFPLWWVITRYWSYLRTWWAARSERSAHARIRKLEKDALFVNVLKEDMRRYVGLMLLHLTRLCIGGFGLTITVVAMATVNTQLDIARALKAVDPSYVEKFQPGVTPVVSALIFITLMVMYWVAALWGIINFVRLRRLSNLGRYERTIKEQIEGLRARWGNPP